MNACLQDDEPVVFSAALVPVLGLGDVLQVGVIKGAAAER
jgi:hypothetical protein